MLLDPDQPFDLAATLESGQAHRWRREEDWYAGVIRGNFIKIRQTGPCLEFHSQPGSEASLVPLLQSYFRLDDDLDAVSAGQVRVVDGDGPGRPVLPWTEPQEG